MDRLSRLTNLKTLIFASLFLVVIGVSLGGYQFWAQLAVSERTVIKGLIFKYFAYASICALMLLYLIKVAVTKLIAHYILPIKKINEELILLTTSNPSHRIKPEGSIEIRKLIHKINETADRLETNQVSVQSEVHIAKAKLEEEKNRLAAVLSGLPEGIIICAQEGQIVLFNKRAKQLLRQNTENKPESSELLGLGRSIFGIFDKDLVLLTLDQLIVQLNKQNSDNTGFHFIHMNQENKMLRIQTLPILNMNSAMNGFILVLYDITERFTTANNRDIFLESLTVSIRSSISSIRAAIETIIDFPETKPQDLKNLRKVIHEESIALGKSIDQPEAHYFLTQKPECLQENVRCLGLLETIKSSAEDRLKVQVTIRDNEEALWARIDYYTIVQLTLFLMSRLIESKGVQAFVCEMRMGKTSLIFDLAWQGDPISLDELKIWEEARLGIGKQVIPFTLKEVLKQHDTEIWPQTSSAGFPCIRMHLPMATAAELNSEWRNNISIQSRPEFYEFDLFYYTPGLKEIENLPLSDLTYTVFDTETTGLNPQEDEIISLGAVRIVGERLLKEENFDRLVDPKRSVPLESIKYHGIQPEMLHGQPLIAETLRSFHSFADNTVLIGHNAAFDMKMLQMKEAVSGLQFKNPVLDTLLLSAVVHPTQTGHSIEEIARRLGIRVIGRHTALGDAIVTGEIFLKMIPLLANQGIYTLKEALTASRKTYYARIKF